MLALRCRSRTSWSIIVGWMPIHVGWISIHPCLVDRLKFAPHRIAQLILERHPTWLRGGADAEDSVPDDGRDPSGRCVRSLEPAILIQNNHNPRSMRPTRLTRKQHREVWTVDLPLRRRPGPGPFFGRFKHFGIKDVDRKHGPVPLSAAP